MGKQQRCATPFDVLCVCTFALEKYDGSYKKALRHLRSTAAAGFRYCWAAVHFHKSFVSGKASQTRKDGTWFLILDAIEGHQELGWPEMASVLKDLLYYYHNRGQSRMKRDIPEGFFSDMGPDWDRSPDDIWREYCQLFEGERKGILGVPLDELIARHPDLFVYAEDEEERENETEYKVPQPAEGVPSTAEIEDVVNSAFEACKYKYKKVLDYLDDYPVGYRYFYALLWFHSDYLNGGMTQVRENGSWHLILDAIKASEAFGHPELALILKDMLYYYHKRGRSLMKRRIPPGFFDDMPAEWDRDLEAIDDEYFAYMDKTDDQSPQDLINQRPDLFKARD